MRRKCCTWSILLAARAAARPIGDSPKTGLITSILFGVFPSFPRTRSRAKCPKFLIRTAWPETSRSISFKAARRSTGSSVLDKFASGWLIDPRDCVSDPLSSASASAVVAEIADAGKIVNPGRYLRLLRPLVVLVAIEPSSPSEIFSNHLRVYKIIL